MRDFETAKIAVESALTGHLVFSTLHQRCTQCLVRLIEMGVEPHLIRSAVIGVLAQRLVRTNCPHCREVEPLDVLMRTNLDVGPEEVFWRGKGCDRCHGTGFVGRQAIYELPGDGQDPGRAHPESGVAADVYRDSALASRMMSLSANGVKLARTGAVSLARCTAPACSVGWRCSMPTRAAAGLILDDQTSGKHHQQQAHPTNSGNCAVNQGSSCHWLCRLRYQSARVQWRTISKNPPSRKSGARPGTRDVHQDEDEPLRGLGLHAME